MLLRGTGGVPLAGVSGVVVNITAVDPTAPSHLTVWPTGAPRPATSTLNFTAGETIPNLAAVGTGPSAGLSIFNNAGQVDVVIDVVGYFA